MQNNVNGDPIKITAFKIAIKYLEEFDMCNANATCLKGCEGCNPDRPCEKIKEFDFAKDEAIQAMQNELGKLVSTELNNEIERIDVSDLNRKAKELGCLSSRESHQTMPWTISTMD